MKIAFVFPGQGSQSVGMGKDLWENFDEVKKLYEEASAALGYDVKELSFNGPQEELNKTFRTQPCILTASIAAYRVLTSNNITAYAMAGHSLGEYSAIVAAGVIPFKEAVKLTEKRGTFMQEAVPEGKGLMAAILGLDRQKVDEICLSVESGYVSPANYNSPGQIVIGGEKNAVEDAMKLAKAAGAKRALALAVSAPSHCALMIEASNRLGELLDTIEIRDPEVPIVSNADAVFLMSAERIKASLIKQLNSPLLWEDSVRNMVETGIDTFIEVGPGKVLTGLIKRIEPSARLFNVEDTASLKKTLEELKVQS
ncbi:MAG: [acyl-carrier-protein] S-malonyltransferase [Nitrospiraceae bacterium]|jgi:[acyl-carrier-protein] S-malonyltransferase|nr:MAG: [acyl-carrier-protein] S-malonyltransferase [Nitrospiraceae bacterium]